MGVLQTNEIPFNLSANPDWKTRTPLVADEPELPGESLFKLLKDSGGETYFWNGSRLFRFLTIQGNSVLMKDVETGAPGIGHIYGHATLSRLINDLSLLAKNS